MGERENMGLTAAHTPTQTLRGTWEQILARKDEIPRDSVIELSVYEVRPPIMTPTMVLMKSWLEEDATSDPDEIRVAEENLIAFKRNMNLPRKETGARLLFPEVEENLQDNKS